MTTFAASVTIVDLPAGTTLGGTELFEAIQTTGGVGQSVQVQANLIANLVATSAFTWVQIQNFTTINTYKINIASSLSPVSGGTTVGVSFGSSGPSIYFGSGAPTLSAGTGSIYLRSDGATATSRLYVAATNAGSWATFTASL